MPESCPNPPFCQTAVSVRVGEREWEGETATDPLREEPNGAICILQQSRLPRPPGRIKSQNQEEEGVSLAMGGVSGACTCGRPPQGAALRGGDGLVYLRDREPGLWFLSVFP